jgi:quinol monooxygenase YgiN
MSREVENSCKPPATANDAAGIRRREFLIAAGATVMGIIGAEPALAQDGRMYGLIGKITAVPGQRDALIAILLEGTDAMPGCLSYVVAKDESNADAIWITEVWDSKSSHDESLSLPSVKDAIAKGRSLIAGFGENVVTRPVGGHGLAASKQG